MTDYNAVAEVDVAPTQKRAEVWMDALANYSPAIGRTNRGRSEVIITLPANTLDQAVSTALAVLTPALGQMLTFAVMPTAVFDARLDDVNVPELVGATEAAKALGVSRQRVQQMAAAGDLPSVRVGNALGFPASIIEAQAMLHAMAEAGRPPETLVDRIRKSHRAAVDQVEKSSAASALAQAGGSKSSAASALAQSKSAKRTAKR